MYAKVQVCKFASKEVCKCKSVQGRKLCLYASMHQCKCASMQEYKYAYRKVCEYAIIHDIGYLQSDICFLILAIGL